MQKSNRLPASSALLNSPLQEGCLKGGVLNEQSVLKSVFYINTVTIKHNPITDLPYQPRLKERAKSLRQAENLPEVLFWMQVNKRKFHKLDFDRQRIIGNYIVDFYIKQLGLVIEIDGDSHDEKVDYGKAREDYLISLGLNVYRILVDDVMKHMDFVLIGLEDYLVKEYGVTQQ